MHEPSEALRYLRGKIEGIRCRIHAPPALMDDPPPSFQAMLPDEGKWRDICEVVEGEVDHGSVVDFAYYHVERMKKGEQGKAETELPG